MSNDANQNKDKNCCDNNEKSCESTKSTCCGNHHQGHNHKHHKKETHNNKSEKSDGKQNEVDYVSDVSDATNSLDNIDINNTNIDSENATEETGTEITDVATLQKLLAEAINKVDEFKNHYLMAKAEADNIQKRSARDVENAHKYALDKFIPDLLAIKDSLELGAKAAQDAKDKEKTDLDSFIEGSKMTIAMFDDALTKQRVVTVNPHSGEDFNPEFHQAITMLESDVVAANKIIEVIQKGYLLNERLIRPALVIVAKASVNAANATNNTNNASN